MNDRLTDILRSSIYDPSSINVIGYDNTYYIQESDVEKFMMDHDILSESVVLSDICEANHINDIKVIDESDQYSDIISLFEAVSLLEAIDAKEIMDVADGKLNTRMMVDQICAFVLKRKYDKASELDAAIKKCDDLIKDIDEELKVADDRYKNSSYKFMGRFIFNIIKKLLVFFVYPLFMKSKLSKTIKLPGKLKKFVSIDSNKSIILNNIYNISDIMNIIKTANDYKSLLRSYKASIQKVRNKLAQERKYLKDE